MDVITLMVDLLKCFEMVAPEVLVREAMEVNFPPRLVWLLIQLYRQPRVVRAHGSNSEFFISFQGIVAGRLGMQALGGAWEFVNGQMSAQPSWSRVRGPLGALWLTLHRIGWRLTSATTFESDLGTVLDLNQMAPRDVRDQVVQGVTRWLLARAESHIETHNGEQFWYRGIRRCVEKAVRDPSERGSLQCVWTDAMWPRQKKYEKRLIDCGKCLACGAERETNAHRLYKCPALLDPALHESAPSEAILKARERLDRLAWESAQAAGITPSVTHGASVSGVSDAVLKPIRSIAALLAGVRPTGSICMGMLMQDQPHYDPLYAATTNIVFMYASMLWEGRLGMQALGDAWEFVNGQMSAQPSWSRVRGPLGALWLTLHRIGWRLASATTFESDLGTVLDLNQMAPRDVRDQVVQGVTRWLLARAESHIETHNGEQFWYRGIRRCVEKAVRDPSERGSLQCVWTDAMWPRQKKYEKRLIDCGKCLACGAERETNAHRLYKCPALLDPALHESAPSEAILKARERLDRLAWESAQVFAEYQFEVARCSRDAFAKLGLFKLAVKKAVKFTKARIRNAPASTTEEKLSACVGFSRALDRNDWKNAGRIQASCPRLRGVPVDQGAAATQAYRDLLAHLQELGHVSVKERVDELKRVRKGMPEIVYKQRKDGILSSLRRLLPGATCGLSAVRDRSGGIVSEPEALATALTS
ncbi:unnamed protein product [Prorocentrum cordatum]|uniref:Reverse transcriptase domain-containing protein n=1 Tax=Prorocentrum cordatum TaxID=2364126 RepID=A0ABN9WB54_9DINO|nr:unnamed protein product [Polarella glacialis]